MVLFNSVQRTTLQRARRCRVRIIAVLTLLVFCSFAGAQNRSFVSFDAPDATKGTFAYSINASGVVTGVWQNTSFHGFVRQPNGQITEFDVPQFSSTYAVSVNVHGQIAGHVVDSQNKNRAFLRTRGGRLVVFDFPGAVGTLALQINDGGTIVGEYFDGINASHGFLRDAAGNFTAVDVPGAGIADGQGTFPSSLNSNGDVTGFYLDSNNFEHAFVRDSLGNFTSFDIPRQGPDSNTSPSSINSTGAVAGYYSDNGRFNAFIRHANGTITTFTIPGSDADFVEGFNDHGLVCGRAVVTGGARAFVRESSGKIIHISPPLPNQGSFAQAINSNNHVTGFWTDSSGLAHGFVQ